MVEQKAIATRMRILTASFEEMYEHGFQGMRVDAILKKTGLAKGALYHHFPSKRSLGYAVVDELLSARDQELIQVLETAPDPISGLITVLKQLCDSATDESIVLGCPINNLVQEMSGLDEGFNERLCNIHDNKLELIISALNKGIDEGSVKKDINPEIIAGFIISSFQGIRGTAKCMSDKQLLHSLTSVLCDFIETLRS